MLARIAQLAQSVQWWATGCATGVRFPAGARYLYSQCPHSHWSQLASDPMEFATPSLEVLRPEREDVLSHPSCTDVMNGGAVSSLPHISTWLSDSLIKITAKFTFYLILHTSSANKTRLSEFRARFKVQSLSRSTNIHRRVAETRFFKLINTH
jgi:hypothetical protein